MLRSRLTPPSSSPNACTGALPSAGPPTPPFVSSSTAPALSGPCTNSRMLLIKTTNSRPMPVPVCPDNHRTLAIFLLAVSVRTADVIAVVLRRVRAGLIILLLSLLLFNRGSLLVVLILKPLSRVLLLLLLLSLWRVVRSAIAMPHTRLLSFASAPYAAGVVDDANNDDDDANAGGDTSRTVGGTVPMPFPQPVSDIL